jgi:hypothetical protein
MLFRNELGKKNFNKKGCRVIEKHCEQLADNYCLHFIGREFRDEGVVFGTHNEKQIK